MKLFETAGRAGVDRPPVMVAYGCGVDSTAMLVMLWASKQMPDAVLFADTGGEKPQTYQYLFTIDAWMVRAGFPRFPSVWARPPGYEGLGLPERHLLQCVAVVRSDGMYGTLERNCVDNRMLPSLAYGFKSCSDKYKRRPQEKWAKTWAPAVAWWGLSRGGRRPAGGVNGRVVKLIGYNAGEPHRSEAAADDFYSYVYPLRAMGWGRDAAVASIQGAGLAVPDKSACFFCPGSKKPEIDRLRLQWPGLMDRALAMEAGAELKTVKGLGRYFAWSDHLEGGKP